MLSIKVAKMLWLAMVPVWTSLTLVPLTYPQTLILFLLTISCVFYRWRKISYMLISFVRLTMLWSNCVHPLLRDLSKWATLLNSKASGGLYDCPTRISTSPISAFRVLSLLFQCGIRDWGTRLLKFYIKLFHIFLYLCPLCRLLQFAIHVKSLKATNFHSWKYQFVFLIRLRLSLRMFGNLIFFYWLVQIFCHFCLSLYSVYLVLWPQIQISCLPCLSAFSSTCRELI